MRISFETTSKPLSASGHQISFTPNHLGITVQIKGETLFTLSDGKVFGELKRRGYSFPLWRRALLRLLFYYDLPYTEDRVEWEHK